LGVVAREN